LAAEEPTFEAVKYFWREWYTRVTYADGRTFHSEPWLTQWAANRLAERWRERWHHWQRAR
jgi:hypothetical protein